jgi:hypothetical protein
VTYFHRLIDALRKVIATVAGWLRSLRLKTKGPSVPSRCDTPRMDDAVLSALVAEHSKPEPRSREGVAAVFALENALKGEPEFAKPRMIVSGRGAHGWLPQFAAQKMLSLVRNGSSPDAAVAWLRRVPSMTAGSGGAIKLLYGIQCAQRIAITSDIVLLPFAEVPASSIMDWIVSEHERANESPVVHGFTIAPSAALFRPGVVEPLFRDASGDFQNEPPAVWFNDLDDAARLLALIPRAIPIEAAHWFHYDDPDVALLGNFGLSRQGPEIRTTMVTAPVEVTAAAVDGVFTAYRQLKKSDQQRINLALERMIRARCQFVSGNRAIDLAIALEVLFMNTERDEHSYKISMRAARLIQADSLARQRVFMEVRRLYDMRSSMVHTGQVKNEYSLDATKVSAHEIVEAVDVVCTQAIRAFLRLGGIPGDWRPTELA